MSEYATEHVTLVGLFEDAEHGTLPPPDGSIRVLRQPADGAVAVVAFTSHVVVAADIEPEWVAKRLPSGELSESMNPPFLAALCARTGRRMVGLDMVVSAAVLDGPPSVRLTELTDLSHPRVRRARRYRSGVRAWATEGGVIVLGRGLAGRVEVAFEVDMDRRRRGLGRTLARTARQLARAHYPDRAGVWAQVAPGNAASVRTLLAAGFRPMGSEALLVGDASA